MSTIDNFLLYKPLTFDDNNTLYKSSLQLLNNISDYKPNKQKITLKKGSHLFHSSSFIRSTENTFRFPLRNKTYFAITRDTAISVQYFKKMQYEMEMDTRATTLPEIGFVLEFETINPITLDNVENISITEICESAPEEQIIGFYGDLIQKTAIIESYRDFFNGMIELCLKDDLKSLKLIKIHLVNINRNNIENSPHILANKYDEIYRFFREQKTALKFLTGDYKNKFPEEVIKKYEPYLDKTLGKKLYGVNSHIEWFTQNKNKINFDNYVLDTKLANNIEKVNDNYIITKEFIDKWFQEITKQSAGNKNLKQTEIIHILGRNRKIIKEGRTKFIMYNKTLIKLTDARKLEKK